MYIGFTLLEQLIAQISPEQPLYLNLLETLIPGQDGIDLVRSDLLLQTRHFNGQTEDVWYWNLRIGDILAPGGAPWESEHRQLRRAACSALAAVTQFLKAQANVKEIKTEAVIAMPTNLKTVKGWAECLEVDKATKCFRLKQGAAQSSHIQEGNDNEPGR